MTCKRLLYRHFVPFTRYIREVGPANFPQTFQQWIDEKEALKTMIAEGRGKLEWERKIPDENLGELKSMLEAEDFKVDIHK